MRLVLLVPLLLIAVFVWALVHFSVIANLVKTSVEWSPAWLLIVWIGLGVLAGALIHVVLSVCGLWFSGSRRAPWPHHEIESHFVGIVGTIYAVLVAFVVVTAWQARDHAEQLTLQEQHNVYDLFHLAEGYANDKARFIRFMLRDYTNYTAAEWNQMQHEQELCTNTEESDDWCIRPAGAISKHANELAHRIEDCTIAIAPSNPREQVLYQESLRILQTFSENRAERRLRYRSHTVQLILWVSFLSGALILVIMAYFVAGQDWRSQIVRSMALFAMIGMMVALTLVFDRPFVGRTQIPNGSWNELTKHFDSDLDYAATPYHGLPSTCRPKAA